MKHVTKIKQMSNVTLMVVTVLVQLFVPNLMIMQINTVMMRITIQHVTGMEEIAAIVLIRIVINFVMTVNVTKVYYHIFVVCCLLFERREF
jgi:hypothetical protein